MPFVCMYTFLLFMELYAAAQEKPGYKFLSPNEKTLMAMWAGDKLSWSVLTN